MMEYFQLTESTSNVIALVSMKDMNTPLVEAKNRLGHGSEKGFMQRAGAIKTKSEKLHKKITPHIKKTIRITQQAALGALHTRQAGQELGFHIGGATGKKKGTIAGAGIGAGLGGVLASTTSSKTMKRVIAKTASQTNKLTKQAKNPAVKKALKYATKRLATLAGKTKGRIGVAGVLGAAALGAGIGAKALGSLGEIKGSEIGETKLGKAGTLVGAAAGAAGLGGSVSRVAAAAAQGAAEGRKKGRKRGFKLGGTIGAGLGFAAAKLLKAGQTTAGKGGLGSRVGAGLLVGSLGAQLGSAILAKRHAERRAKQAASGAVLGGFSPDAAAALQRKIENTYNKVKRGKVRAKQSLAILKQQFGI